MNVIETRIDTNSNEYKKNHAALTGLVSDLKNELKRAHDERSQKSLDRVFYLPSL